MRRSIVLISVSVLLFALVGAEGFAQSGSLPVSVIKTVVDGVAHPNEYSFSQAFGPLTLSANRTADTRYLAVAGKTSGWVAVGLGSLKMNGATIFMGFVDGDGKVQFKAQAGAGHTHTDAAKSVTGTVISSAITEAGGTTILEIALKAGAYITSGQPALDLIFALGEGKSFTPVHSYRNATSLKLN
jgi:hypothetical protein